MGKWIDINVIPAPICDSVLIRLEVIDNGLQYQHDPEVDVGYINNQFEWVTFNGWPNNVWRITHWMPLPYPDLD